MSATSSIEWTDATWNPVTGCTKVSPGCDHCYAEKITERFHGPGSFAKVTLHPDRLDLPLRWRKPRRVFVNSMSDLFHDAIPDWYIARVFAVMAQAEAHTFQVLTKRHGRARSLLSSPKFAKAVDDEWCGIPDWSDVGWREDAWWGQPWPLPNVWLGVSVEDQRWADIRIPSLLDTPAAVRFLSCEPLLGPVSLDSWIGGGRCDMGCPGGASDHSQLCAIYREPDIGWVIAGGESGRGARPMYPDWPRQIRDQCEAAGVPFLFKQWGAWVPTTHVGLGVDETGRRICVPDSSVVSRYKEGRWLERVGKGNAGRELDGRIWDDYPAAIA